jgi:hypothetical protein
MFLVHANVMKVMLLTFQFQVAVKYLNVNLFAIFVQYLEMCSTTTYSKSNGAIACGYDIQSGLNWYQAANECTKIGARLPEIADARENNEIYIRMVISLPYNSSKCIVDVP